MFKNNTPGNNVLAIAILICLIFYQLIITLLIPLRWNIILLIIEIFLFFYFLSRVIWPS
jgi:hypothetical protein